MQRQVKGEGGRIEDTVLRRASEWKRVSRGLVWCVTFPHTACAMPATYLEESKRTTHHKQTTKNLLHYCTILLLLQLLRNSLRVELLN